MERKLDELAAWLESRIAFCNERQKLLLADDRGDEAAFEKVKANVYDIFRTILSVAVKTCKGDAAAANRFFLLKTEQIPANWAASFQRAEQNGDTEKMQIEGIKIDTIREIKTKFTEIWEGSK